MKCEKCKKECLKSELTNGLCNSCLSINNIAVNKKQIFITTLISSLISIILSITIILMMSGKTSELDVKDFIIGNTTYSKDTSFSTSYSGKTTILCPNKNGTYLLICSMKLISGGNYEDIGKTNYVECIVHNGEGIIQTYDYGDSITEPVYEIEILGYRSFY